MAAYGIEGHRGQPWSQKRVVGHSAPVIRMTSDMLYAMGSARSNGESAMRRLLSAVGTGLMFLALTTSPTFAMLTDMDLKAKSAILIDMQSGDILHEQDADLPIAPASLTKILTIYIVSEAVKNGELHLWDEVHVSRKAAMTGGSRMGLRAGTLVPVEELIKGMAVVSGNDACVAVAEHMSGSVEGFVRRMNVKARELGMVNSVFMTPNGLPAKGQVTTARDMAKLSLAYLRRFPDSLSIHSMRSYTYRDVTRKNANRLLGRCPGVDGLKTGFVCASGYNLSATAKRGDTRLLAVVMGASSPSLRACETAKLLEQGYRKVAPELADAQFAQALEAGTAFVTPQEGSCRIGTRRGRVVAGKGRVGRAFTADAGVGQRSAGKVAKVSGRSKRSLESGPACSGASRHKLAGSRTNAPVALKRPGTQEPTLITNKPGRIGSQKGNKILPGTKREVVASKGDKGATKGVATAGTLKAGEKDAGSSSQKAGGPAKGNQAKNRQARKAESDGKPRQQVQGKSARTGKVL